MESDNQKGIMKYLSSRDDIYFFRANSGSFRIGGDKYTKGRFVQTGKAGCPDIVVCWRDKWIGLEVKDYKKYQSEIQLATEKYIKKIGGMYFVVHDREEVIEIFKNLEIKYSLW